MDAAAVRNGGGFDEQIVARINPAIRGLDERRYQALTVIR
jgi:hypothetical protein